MLKAVQLLQALLDDVRQFVRLGVGDAQLLVGARRHCAGQHTAHGLLHAAVGIVDEGVQAVQQPQRHRRRQPDGDGRGVLNSVEGHVESLDGHRIGLAGHGRALRDGEGLHRQCQRDGVVAGRRQKPARHLGIADLTGHGGPAGDSRAAVRQIDRLVSRVQQGQGRRVHAHGAGQRLAGEVLADGIQREFVSQHRETGQGRPGDDVLGHEDVGRGVAHLRVQRDCPRDDTPGGQVVG